VHQRVAVAGRQFSGCFLIRADSIVMLASVRDGLNAEYANGRTVRLAEADRWA
jgi:hypothetical protein